MNTADIRLFGRFQIAVDGRELPLAPSTKELLALLVVAAGHRITAKGLWKILYEYRGINYNATFYTTRVNDMKSELEFFHIADIVSSISSPLRACRLNMDVVHCDYYEMLDGNGTFGKESDFLPGYGWAKAFYKTNWSDLHVYWDSLKF